jgi:nucleotidyltransferase/DNA polymerase involved in DNA repair
MIACVLVPYFAAAVERRDDPSLAAVPLVIGAAMEDSGKVFAVSAEAARMGVQPGLSLRQARALCPHARFVPADQARYRHAFDALLEVLAGFTPLIEPSLVLHSALCWLDLGKLGKPEAAEMSRHIGQTLREKVRLAPAIGLAAGKFPSYVAAASLEPNKALILASGREAAFLAPFPLDVLPVNGEMTRQLRLLGIRTLGQLAALPASAVLAQFGVQGQLPHQLARGCDERPVLPRRPQATESASRQFEAPVADGAVLEAALQAMAVELAQRLQARSLIAQELRLILHLEDAAPRRRDEAPRRRDEAPRRRDQAPHKGDNAPRRRDEVTREARLVMRRPTGDPGRLARILYELMARIQVESGITGLEVILTDMRPATGQQLDLFVHRTGQESRLRHALKDLVARYGAGCFYRVSLINPEAHLPERRFRLQEVDAP